MLQVPAELSWAAQTGVSGRGIWGSCMVVTRFVRVGRAGMNWAATSGSSGMPSQSRRRTRWPGETLCRVRARGTGHLGVGEPRCRAGREPVTGPHPRAFSHLAGICHARGPRPSPQGRGSATSGPAGRIPGRRPRSGAPVQARPGPRSPQCCGPFWSYPEVPGRQAAAGAGCSRPDSATGSFPRKRRSRIGRARDDLASPSRGLRWVSPRRWGLRRTPPARAASGLGSRVVRQEGRL